VNFGFVLSLVLVLLAVVGVFIEIPIVGDYAFWFAVGAYIISRAVTGGFDVNLGQTRKWTMHSQRVRPAPHNGH
jgi:hypothetical protein